LTGQGGISVIASRITLEGPINDDITYMISGRRMYLDLLLGLFLSSEDKKNTPDYYFYDFNAKVNYKISDKDRIYVSGFFGRDVIGASPGSDNSNNRNESLDFGINWGNSTASAKWVHIFSPELFGNSTLIYTTYKFGSEFKETSYDDNGILKTNQFISESQIRDFSLKADVQYFPDELHTIKTGIEATQHRFFTSIGDEISNQFGGLLATENTINAVDAALYLQDEWRITDKLSTNLGGRLYYFQNGNYLRFEPRAQFAYQMNDDIKFTSSFSIANQFLHLITRNDINLPTDLWFPSTKTILPSTSTQGMLGFETTFGEKKDYLFTAEAYYKDMRNLLEYKDTASFSFGTPVESQFVSGRGEAYGLELFLNKRIGDFTGWLGYTLSWTKRYFDELDNGHPFYARYDSRHDLSATFTYDLSENIELGASWIYQTGFAYTMPIGTYSLDPSTSNQWGSTNRLYSDRNGYRLPSYHRLDVNLGFKTHILGMKSTISLSVYNLYNRKNPFAQYVQNDYDPNTGDVTPVLKQLTLFPLLPILSWSFSF
ncbi:MAG: TonB-dependent receptor, partial [Bacteroidetes bacterium]|nr:TonB-dependent receptor [Bacteroidota bacterium]